MSICATFTGGPWNGKYKVLADARLIWYVPVLEDDSIRAMPDSQDPGEYACIKAGEYRRQSYGEPKSGLHHYLWDGVRR